VSNPVVMHGVSLSIGSSDPLNRAYLETLRAATRRLERAWVSDHLCWTGVGGRNLHDLLPLPYTEETVIHVAGRIRQVQEILERTILIENVSSYMAFRSSRLEEWEFLTAVAEEADCGILLDINNIFVSAFNHRFDPLRYIDAVPADRVMQFHLAGHSDPRQLPARYSRPSDPRRGLGTLRARSAALRPRPDADRVGRHISASPILTRPTKVSATNVGQHRACSRRWYTATSD
jgi:uncharacterized protein (UPF0276 family)